MNLNEIKYGVPTIFFIGWVKDTNIPIDTKIQKLQYSIATIEQEIKDYEELETLRYFRHSLPSNLHNNYWKLLKTYPFNKMELYKKHKYRNKLENALLVLITGTIK